MRGLMQDVPLTIDRMLDHAAAWHPTREIVSRDADGGIRRTDYAGVHAMAKRVSNALRAEGIGLGDRVATMAWNSDRHLAAWYGAGGIGAVLHTLNPRLFLDQIAYIANHAGDRILLADPACAATVAALLPRVPGIARVVFLCDAEGMPAVDFPAIAFDDWIAPHGTDCAWGGFDENLACGLCYTSGTTGDPKGVLYSHRSNWLHALLTLQADALALSARDTVLVIVPMYHANAWGVAHSAPMVGAKLVMPGMRMDGASLYDLIEREGCTFSAAVPTVWQGLLAHVEATGATFSTLRRVIIGGAAAPEPIVRAFRDRYGVEVLQGWGMTETSPLATISAPTAEVAAMDAEARLGFQLRQGRLMCGLEMRVVDEDGPVRHDGETPGRLLIRGPTVASRYFGNGGAVLDEDGWFDTGDIATIDGRGYMHIVDRAKDVIKSGGEWISSIEIENAALAHPAIAAAAVIGLAHPKWDERPLLLCQLATDATATRHDLLSHLDGRIAKWWIPDDVIFVEAIPIGATGKIDKKAIRAGLATYRWPA